MAASRIGWDVLTCPSYDFRARFHYRRPARSNEAMLDPVSIALANAPIDREPLSEEGARSLAEAHASTARGEVIPHEEVLREFGLSPEAFERMGRTPLDPDPQDHPEQ